jgi:hypothetical protein
MHIATANPSRPKGFFWQAHRAIQSHPLRSGGHGRTPSSFAPDELARPASRVSATAPADRDHPCPSERVSRRDQSRDTSPGAVGGLSIGFTMETQAFRHSKSFQQLQRRRSVHSFLRICQQPFVMQSTRLLSRPLSNSRAPLRRRDGRGLPRHRPRTRARARPQSPI